jgi:hypothetical protein
VCSIVVGGIIGCAGLFGLGLSLLTLFAYAKGEPPTEPGYTLGGAIGGLIMAVVMLFVAGWLFKKSISGWFRNL